MKRHLHRENFEARIAETRITEGLAEEAGVEPARHFDSTSLVLKTDELNRHNPHHRTLSAIFPCNILLGDFVRKCLNLPTGNHGYYTVAGGEG